MKSLCPLRIVVAGALVAGALLVSGSLLGSQLIYHPLPPFSRPNSNG